MLYNDFYEFITSLNLDFSESVDHEGLNILDLPDLDLQIHENESSETLDYYDNLEMCNMVYGVQFKQLQKIVLDRIKVLEQ